MGEVPYFVNQKTSLCPLSLSDFVECVRRLVGRRTPGEGLEVSVTSVGADVEGSEGVHRSDEDPTYPRTDSSVERT